MIEKSEPIGQRLLSQGQRRASTIFIARSQETGAYSREAMDLAGVGYAGIVWWHTEAAILTICTLVRSDVWEYQS